MSFKKSWDVTTVTSQIHSLARECKDPHNDGFTSFCAKQDLYLLKEMIDQAIEESPDFGDLEKNWLHEREKKRIIKILKS